MDFTDVISSRFSCKSFDGRPVEQEKLDFILEASRCAPTAKNQQEHKIYVLSSDNALAKVDSVTRCRYSAATVLAVAYDKNNVYTYPGGKHASGVEDATIVSTHMLLAATSLGVNSCWVNNFDPELLAGKLGLPENEQIVMLLMLGYASDGVVPLPPHTQRKELSETVKYI